MARVLRRVFMKEGTGITPEIESTVEIIQGMGYTVIEAQSRPVKRNVQVVIYIYHPEGITLEDCTKVYRTVMPRLEITFDTRNINLEVSSPGLGRMIKFFREFSLFTGRSVKVMTEDSSEWIHAEIISADDNEVVLAGKDGEKRYGRTDIVKAKISEA